MVGRGHLPIEMAPAIVGPVNFSGGCRGHIVDDPPGSSPDDHGSAQHYVDVQSSGSNSVLDRNLKVKFVEELCVLHTVDGWNPVTSWGNGSFPLLYYLPGIYTSQVVHGFFHQQ